MPRHLERSRYAPVEQQEVFLKARSVVTCDRCKQPIKVGWSDVSLYPNAVSVLIRREALDSAGISLPRVLTGFYLHQHEDGLLLIPVGK